MNRIKEYRESSAINQSFLKDVLNNRTEEKEATEVMILGNVVDCLITSPEEFDAQYVVKDIEAPMDMYRKPIDKVVGLVQIMEDGPVSMGEMMNNLVSEFKYCNNLKWKEETIERNLLQFGEPYWESLMESLQDERQMITTADYLKCQRVVNSLLSHPHTHKHFKVGEPLVEEILYQQPLYFTYKCEGEEFECKALPDMVNLNHALKTVQVKDIKITDVSTAYWPQIARKLRYELQLSFYFEAVARCYPDYVLLPPLFIVESFKYPGKPRVYECSPNDLFVGKHGGTIHRGYLCLDEREDGHLHAQEILQYVQGFDDAFRLIIQSRELGIEDYDVETFRNQGHFKLDLWT